MYTFISDIKIISLDRIHQDTERRSMAKLSMEGFVPLCAILHWPREGGRSTGHLVCASKVGENWWCNNDDIAPYIISTRNVQKYVVCVAVQGILLPQ